MSELRCGLLIFYYECVQIQLKWATTPVLFQLFPMRFVIMVNVLMIPGPLMIITQRVTSVAFWVHDGREKCGDANSTKPNRDNGKENA